VNETGPIPRLALSREEAAVSLGMSLDSFERHVQPTVRMVRLVMIAAGVNVKALSTFMGHANIRITLDQYGHLLPGAEDEAAGLLDAFLARQFGGAEVEQPAVRRHGMSEA
jgi:hypothetical protein